MLDQHKTENLRAFCKTRVRRWTDNHFKVYMTWGHGKPILCDVTEIEPEGESLLSQNQYRLNLTTSRYELHKVPSPPLGIMLLNVKVWRSGLEEYLDDLLSTDFDGFPEMCFQGVECAIQRDLLKPIHRYTIDSTTTVVGSL